MIKVSIARLGKEKVVLDGEKAPEFLEWDNTDLYRIVAPVKYHLECQLTGGDILVKGWLETQIAGDCGRCLKAVETEVTVPDLCWLIEAGDEDELDLTDEVRSEMLLALPMNLLCDEDCAGLCPVCGGDLNKKKCGCVLPEVEVEAEPP